MYLEDLEEPVDPALPGSAGVWGLKPENSLKRAVLRSMVLVAHPLSKLVEVIHAIRTKEKAAAVPTKKADEQEESAGLEVANVK